MSDGGNYEIRYSNRFESTYKKIFRTYYRKNVAQGDEFEKFFDRLEQSMTADPYLGGSVRMPWPGSFGRPDWDLCKLKFHMPSLKGASRLGRLLYAIGQQEKIVCLLWIYTHQDYPNQPPTKELRKVFSEVFRHLEG